MAFSDFFTGQPAPPPQPNPEPPGFDLIRDLLMRKAFGLQADPYGYGAQQPQGFSTGLINAPAFGGGNTPGYPPPTTSGPGGSQGGWGRVPRVVSRPSGLTPGARVPIQAGGSPPLSGRMSGMAGSMSPAPGGGSGDMASLLASMLGGTQGGSFDGCRVSYDGSNPGHPHPGGEGSGQQQGHPNWSPFEQGHGGPLGAGESWAQRLGMSGANVMQQHDSMHPNAAPELFQGNWQGGGGGIGGSHTFMTRDSQGNYVPIAEQNGLNGQAGKQWGRPTDPRAAAAWDRFSGRPHVGFGGSTNVPPPLPPPAPAPGRGRQVPLPPPTHGMPIPRPNPTR